MLATPSPVSGVVSSSKGLTRPSISKKKTELFRENLKMSYKVELNLRELICVEQAIEDRIERCETRIAKCNELGMASASAEWQERINAAKAVLAIVKNS